MRTRGRTHRGVSVSDQGSRESESESESESKYHPVSTKKRNTSMRWIVPKDVCLQSYALDFTVTTTGSPPSIGNVKLF